MLKAPTRPRLPHLNDFLFWIAVAVLFVWMLGPPVDWRGKNSSGSTASLELAEAEDPDIGSGLPLKLKPASP